MTDFAANTPPTSKAFNLHSGDIDNFTHLQGVKV